jgi:hypothetical protein
MRFTAGAGAGAGSGSLDGSDDEDEDATVDTAAAVPGAASTTADSEPLASRASTPDMDSEEDSAHSVEERRREKPRVLVVQNSRVVTFVPGTGLRPFLFSRVFNETATQVTSRHAACCPS